MGLEHRDIHPLAPDSVNQMDHRLLVCYPRTHKEL